jgi:dolichyl-phosphate-mannose--protein O-mannosyl transferase
MRIFVIAMLVLIVGSLVSALWFLIRDKGTSERTVKALTVRISLSIGLFLLLMAGYYFGIIPKTGLH